jgi:hypothetical protein
MLGKTPMMQQYMKIKDKLPDAILFFRLGDFYEMFFDDALLASKELELTLTGRDCGQEERAPMCGVPYHSCEGYIARLIGKGYKVAICEQTEDPALAKGLVKREVVRVITPGTVVEGSMLEETRNNYICALYIAGEEAGMAFADVSTGEIFATASRGGAASRAVGELGRFCPKEIIVNGEGGRTGRSRSSRETGCSASSRCVDRGVFRREGGGGKHREAVFPYQRPPAFRISPGRKGPRRPAPVSERDAEDRPRPYQYPPVLHRGTVHGAGPRHPAKPRADRDHAAEGQAGLAARRFG